MVLILVLLLEVSSLQWQSSFEQATAKSGRRLGSAKRDKSDMSNGRKAMETWARSLTASDYDAPNWKYKFKSITPEDYFDHFVKALSQVFAEEKAHVNFALVGACDGLNDPTIESRFLPNKHWRAVFVEPMTPNVKDLTTYLTKNQAMDRSIIIQAACTRVCENPTLQVERPLYEEINNNKTADARQDIPHWLRREIGSIMPKNRAKARPDWIVEDVRCVTAADVLMEWTNATKSRKNADKEHHKLIKKDQGTAHKMRPHILKIDAEGHDHEVLMSFVNQNTPLAELPLLIEFEAKIIEKHFATVKRDLENIGYVVSDYAGDAVALLKGDKILQVT